MATLDRSQTEAQLPAAVSGWQWRDWFEPGEPHPYVGPFSRWPRTTDAILALIVFAVSLVAVAASAVADGDDLRLGDIGDHPVGAFALLAISAAVLLQRRSQPIAVTAAVLAAMIAWALGSYGDGHELALVVAIYGVGRYSTDYRQSLVAVGAVVGVSLLGSVIDGNQRIDIWPAFLFAIVPWYVGRRIHNRGDYLALVQERAERLEADQHAQARQAVLDERSRIARELHDVVAHQVSMMTIQAGAARTIAGTDIDKAVAAMSDVEQAGREALSDLRHLLGVLRPKDAESVDLGPQPGVADITALTDQLSHIGSDVTVNVTELPDDLSMGVGVAIYRIVQESITNIIKHAGPRPVVSVNIGMEDGLVAVDITNSTKGLSPELPKSGYGITGMRERAEILGGTLTAGPHPPHGFFVNARLPLDPGKS